jgi:uncharacterized protein
MTHSLSEAEARRAAVAASGIGTLARGGAGQTFEALRRLGSVQIDTISVVERAHHHVLWTRNADYGRDHLPELEAEPRRAIEYWSHAAAYLPLDEYRFCLPRMARVRAQGHEWFKAESSAIDRVRDRIRAEGPMRAQDFGEEMRGRSGWWDWKPAKIALEYLFHSGELISIGRRGFQKVYELAERALPPSLDLTMPSGPEMAARYVDQAIASLGVFEAADIAYMRKDGREGIAAELSARVGDGRLLELDLAGPGAARSSLRRGYASPAVLEAAASGSVGGEARIRILSPFDPLIIDRKRCSRLFGRAYQLECYLPEAKRAFGYFALPLLYLRPDGGAELAGLLDAKADRGRSELLVRRLSLYPPEGAGGCAAAARAAAAALAEFAAFNGVEGIALERFESSDGRMERSLRAAVARL